MTERRRQEDRSAGTRAALMAAARSVFAEVGYAAASREEIVARAGVTRGALHHHFGSKEGLFRAVHEAVEQEVVAKVGGASSKHDDALARLEAGCRAFIDATSDPAVLRITLIDAPAVLGWETCREVDAKYGLGLLIAGLTGAMDAGAITRQPVEPLASFILGGLMEAAMRVARAPDRANARGEAIAAITNILKGLRRRV